MTTALDIEPDLFDLLEYRSSEDRCVPAASIGCRRCGTSSQVAAPGRRQVGHLWRFIV